MKSLFKIGLVIIILAIIGGAFYWYSYRPIQIRKECYLFLQVGGGFIDEKQSDGLPSLKTMPVPSEQREGFYRDCLRMNGLEK